ncbi:hypothetical protein Celaphus_00007304 [Cervus elaphus hippelaphus]|uniref:Uncharacterized protein n=1 Tax=Cervus elaphus hippelaphus TaxID=46360 RepID=A0A212CYV4_CEREH|nr:hypothetical protein Celaphus_00007304 [Cervus elaphus hippelaphus]
MSIRLKLEKDRGTSPHVTMRPGSVWNRFWSTGGTLHAWFTRSSKKGETSDFNLHLQCSLRTAPVWARTRPPIHAVGRGEPTPYPGSPGLSGGIVPGPAPWGTRLAGQHPPLRAHGLRQPEQAVWRTHAADTGSYCSQAFLTLGAAVGTEEVLGQAKDPMPGDTPGRPAATAVTLQRLEALEGDPLGARHELQQPGPPLLVEGLHRLPEPPDHIAVGPAVLQPRVGLPVVQVNLVQAADDQLRGMKVGHFLDTQRDAPPRLPGRRRVAADVTFPHN